MTLNKRCESGKLLVRTVSSRDTHTAPVESQNEAKQNI